MTGLWRCETERPRSSRGLLSKTLAEDAMVVKVMRGQRWPRWLGVVLALLVCASTAQGIHTEALQDDLPSDPSERLEEV